MVCEYEGRAGVGKEISPSEKAVRETEAAKMLLQVTPNSPSLSLKRAGRAGALSISSSPKGILPRVQLGRALAAPA